jgi:hypothetical protein
MNATERKIRSFLIELARSEETISYQDLCNKLELGLNMKLSRDRNNILGPMLGNILRYEHQNGRPLLPALVVRKKDEWAGNGFWGVVAELEDISEDKLCACDYDILQQKMASRFWSNDAAYNLFK